MMKFDFNFSADITNGNGIANELSLMGLRCHCVETIESPSAFIHNFSVDNPIDLLKLDRLIKVLALRYKTIVNSGVSVGKTALSADFCLIFDKAVATSVFWQDYKTALKKPFDFLLGIDTTNNPIVLNLDNLPHLLIAGETGGGKSVTLNTIIKSLTSVKGVSAKNLGLVLIDTKQTELSAYENSPFLSLPVCTNFRSAFIALNWLNDEMLRRYSTMKANGLKTGNFGRLVLIVDELADLMMQDKKSLEPLIVRLAQLGRACNIHLILATQRPTVDVCTGHIKANIPSRIALQTASARDSMNILDRKGAEKLRGKGDALLKLSYENDIKRVQCFNYKK